MNDEILKQYNDTDLRIGYDNDREEMNYNSNNEFRKFLSNIDLHKKRVLDIGCGFGDIYTDIATKGGIYTGIDISDQMISSAKRIHPGGNFIVCDCRNMNCLSLDTYDVIVSKWALQSIDIIDAAYSQIIRVGKNNAKVLLLVAHPIRQFLEKKIPGKNYFMQEIVNSKIFNNTITVQEPSHTMSDIISPLFLENFSITEIYESYDFPGAEQINGDIYPTHLIIVATLHKA
jgi:ubiquinone/menaquinone biosynthesis C-methylase UbiE